MSSPYGPGQPYYVQQPYGQSPYGQPPGGSQGGFSYGWISESFQLFTQAAGIWIALVFIVFVSSFVLGLILNVIFPPTSVTPAMMPPGANPFVWGMQQGMSGGGSPAHVVVQQGCSIFLNAFFGACSYNIALAQVRGEQVGFDTMFSGARNIVQMLIYTVLLFIATIAGMLVLCFGLFVVMGLLLPAGAMIANGESALESFSKSINLMKGSWLPASCLIIIYVLIAVVGIIPCCLGLLVTYPMYYIMSALAYRDMSGGFIPTVSSPNFAVTGNPGAWPPPPSQQSGQWPPAGPSQSGQWPPAGPSQSGQWPPAGPSSGGEPPFNGPSGSGPGQFGPPGS